MLENIAEDTVERIKTSVIILEGMTRLKIAESFEGLCISHMLINHRLGDIDLNDELTSNYTSFRVEMKYLIAL